MWTSIVLLFFVSVSILSLGSDAAPAKKGNNVIKAMDISMASSAAPLQLQIEAQAEGKQKMAFLPTVGPGLDFYYLNYRPSYVAGENKIDFWMLTPKGSQPPQSASLELMDEYGKVRLAVLVPEGTEVPQNLARKNEPFLWKSWQVPKELKADFEFTEMFRVLLKTSDAPRVAALTETPTVAYPGSPNAAATAGKKNKKRFELIEFLVKGKNKHVNALDNANTVHSASTTAAALANAGFVVQDRQFRIKGLKANPGGKPNAAKMYVNSVAPASLSAKTPTNDNSNAGVGLGNDVKMTQPDGATGADRTKSVPSLAVRLQIQQRVTLAMLVVLASSAALMCSVL